MENTIDLIRRDILAMERGRIFFIDDFATYDSQWSVRFGLSRMAEEGTILRLARGVYCYPRIEDGISPRTVVPQAETIACAVAAREHSRIIPYGDIAACRLGLTSLRVSDLKYLTDGAPRKICLANGVKIYFNHTSEVKMFDFCNETMQLISSAIRALGEEAIDAEAQRKIRSFMKDVPEKEFNRDIKIPPAWVQKIILEIWNS